MTANLLLVGSYDYRIAALSALITVLAAYVALDIAGRLSAARGWIRLLWLCGASFAMGSGIWAMHYVGMGAFQLPAPVKYDWHLVRLSLFAAILASGIALYAVSRPTVSLRRMIVGGIVMGSGIAAIYYLGMHAMCLPAVCVYSPWLVLLSVVLAILVSYLALQLAFHFRKTSSWRRLGAAILMGLAIPAVDFVGMASVRFVPKPLVMGTYAVSGSGLSIACIVIVTLAIFGLVFVSSLIDRSYLTQLQGVFDNMTEAVVVVDGGRRIVQHNQAATKLLGVGSHIATLHELAKSFEAYSATGKLLDPEERPMMQAIHGIYCKNSEVTLRNKATGATAIVETSTARLSDSADGTRRVVLTFRDITEYKMLDEARTRLASIVEFSEDAIIGKDDKGIITSWNAGAEKIFGYTAAEMIGQSVLCLIPDDHQSEEEEILERLKRGETADLLETVRKKKNGQIIQVSLTISPICDAGGAIIGSSKIARDITQRKQFERQLQQGQKMEAIGQLTGGIAHDFNNLLSVIVGNLGLIGHMVAENEAVLKRVQAAQRAATRGADLILRLLAFSRNVDLNAEPTQLHDSIRNVMELAHSLGPDFKIISNFDDSMPPALVDAAGLENALLNLVINARDAMPKGGTVTIATQVSTLQANYPPVLAGELKAGRYVHITVSDTGQGMSKETQEHVFEPFFTTKPRGKGTGLGLAMVYGFVKQSGGHIHIDSELGLGTNVSLFLPLAESGIHSLPAPIQSRAPAKSGRNVLVVDDEPDVLEVAAVYLEEMGYTVYQANDGVHALEVLKLHRNIDLLVTDLIMPGGINGSELAQKAREWIPQIRVVYCSGFAADALEERNIPLVHGSLINKPYLKEAFEAGVYSAMTDVEAHALSA